MHTQTGEKSLGQKFDDENFGENNENLDTLFNSGNYQKIIDAWKKILKQKWNQALEEHSLSSLYLVNLILYKPEQKLYIFLLKIDQNQLDLVSELKATKKSVFLKNFIDEKLGSAKVYKSKKRLELRLKPAEFIKNNSFLEFNIENKINSKNLRDIFNDEGKLAQYLSDELEKYTNFLKKN